MSYYQNLHFIELLQIWKTSVATLVIMRTVCLTTDACGVLSKQTALELEWEA